jgi:CheY-like chemotaxis protein
MDREIVLALVAIAPQLLVLLVVVIAALRFRKQIGQALGGRVSSVSIFGAKIELNAAEVEHAVAVRSSVGPGPTSQQAPATGAGAPSSSQLVDRARRLAPQLQGRTVLWVDDQPTGNRLERRLLRQMGVFVEAVTTNAQAMTVLDDRDESIDLVISDIQRATGPSGLGLVASTSARPNYPSVILYITRREPDRPVPVGVFGIADRPDDLLNLVMDAIDRLPERG